LLGLVIAFAIGMAQGGGGIQTISLTANLGVFDTVAQVDDTSAFLSADIVTIDSETMSYNGVDATHLFNLVRGIQQTTASTHQSAAYVYTQGSSAINQAIGFNAGALTVSNGIFAVVTIPSKFLFSSIPNIIISSNGLFSGDLSILQYVFLSIGVGIYVVLGLALGTVLAYVLRP
jgi:hypothetical protein